jgi:hypothetical protein
MRQENYNRSREYNAPRSSHGNSNPDWDQAQRSHEDWSDRGRSQNYRRPDHGSDYDDRNYERSYGYRHSDYESPRSSHGTSNPDWDQTLRSREDWSKRGRSSNYGRSDQGSDFNSNYRRGESFNYAQADDENYRGYSSANRNSDERNYGRSGISGYGRYSDRNNENDYRYNYNERYNPYMRSSESSDYEMNYNRDFIDSTDHAAQNRRRDSYNRDYDRYENRAYNRNDDDRDLFQDYDNNIRNSRGEKNNERSYKRKSGSENSGYNTYDRNYSEDLTRMRDKDYNRNYYSGRSEPTYDQNNRSYFNPQGMNRTSQIENRNEGYYGNIPYSEREKYERNNRKRNLQEEYSW